jgi:hypothetical protein
MDNFQHILKQIKEHMEKVHYKNGDLSDIGNEIGIILGNYVESEQDLKDLIQGIRHGISLTNGTH